MYQWIEDYLRSMHYEFCLLTFCFSFEQYELQVHHHSQSHSIQAWGLCKLEDDKKRISLAKWVLNHEFFFNHMIAKFSTVKNMHNFQI